MIAGWSSGQIQKVVVSTCVVLCTSVLVWALDPILHLLRPSVGSKFNPNNEFIVAGKRAIDSHKNIEDAPAVDLTLVIPAYNESKRISTMLDLALSFLKSWGQEKKMTYEIIIVDDKSTDSTKEVVTKYMEKNWNIIRLLFLARNHGKGGAVKQGVMRARGRYILMVDADGATAIEDLGKLMESLEKVQSTHSSIPGTVGVAVGSRAHMEHNTLTSRPFYRQFLHDGFHLLVKVLCTRNIEDTQCGFKLFTRSSARVLFLSLHLERWAFDTEIVYLAEVLGIPLTEVAVNWHEVDGSKLIRSKIDVVTTSLTMARDMFCVRLAYLFGIWSYRRK